MKKWLQKLWLNADMEVSMTKVGANIVGMATAIVALPSMGVVVPVALIGASKIALAVGMVFGINGARDALDKTKTK